LVETPFKIPPFSKPFSSDAWPVLTYLQGSREARRLLGDVNMMGSAWDQPRPPPSVQDVPAVQMGGYHCSGLLGAGRISFPKLAVQLGKSTGNCVSVKH